MYSMNDYICTLPEAVQTEFITDVKKLSYTYTDEEIARMLNERLCNLLDLSSECEEVGLTYEKYSALLTVGSKSL